MRPADALTIVDCSGVGPGGITRTLTELVRHWPAGHRLRLVAAPDRWEPPADRVADVTIAGRQAPGRARTISSSTAALRRESARAARDGGGLVLSLSPSMAVVGSVLPVTTVVHDFAFRLWPQGLSRQQLRYRALSYRFAVRRSARLLCVSARTRHDLVGLYGVAPERAATWQPGSDLPARPGRLPETLATVRSGYLLVAGHAPHKGVELAIAAVAGMPGRTLAVLTGGRDVERFAALAAGSGAADRILFLDRLAEADYAAAVAGATVFLMPSHFEGYGLPAVEALRLGTPTVISPDPALFEATGTAAFRMRDWSCEALRLAIVEAERAPRRPVDAGRTWRDATGHLVALLAGASGA